MAAGVACFSATFLPAAHRRLVAAAFGPRRSARATHLCSVRLTHTKNTIWRRARDGASDIIHAEGVRRDFPSSAPKARNPLTSHEEAARCRRKNRPPTGAASPHGICRAARKALLPGRKTPPNWPWWWVTFGEQSRVIFPKCRSLWFPSRRPAFPLRGGHALACGGRSMRLGASSSRTRPYFRSHAARVISTRTPPWEGSAAIPGFVRLGEALAGGGHGSPDALPAGGGDPLAVEYGQGRRGLRAACRQAVGEGDCAGRRRVARGLRLPRSRLRGPLPTFAARARPNEAGTITLRKGYVLHHSQDARKFHHGSCVGVSIPLRGSPI
jgi:hypothetical protein